MATTISNLQDKSSRINREAGFSLPEILIAVVIFGILVAIALPIFLAQQTAVTQNALKAQLVSASTIVENERANNNGIYPNYTPRDIANSTQYAGFVYTYSDTQLVYCLAAPDGNGGHLYIGSQTNKTTTTTDCTQANVGGAQPSDNSGTIITPPTNNNPAITALSPVSQTSLNPGTIVTVTGSHFLTGATVIFNGVSVPASTSNSGTLTFVSPGNSAYTTVGVQVKNPNARTSNTVSYAFINPIIGTTAATPTGITVTNISATAATISAAPISCPFSATPQYSFKLTQVGPTTNNNGILWVDSTGRDVSQFSTSNTFTANTSYQGWQFTASVEAQCTLAGSTGNASTYSPSKSWVQLMSTPAAPSSAPTTSSTQPVINSSYTISWAAQTALCPSTATTVTYNLYANGTLISTQTGTSKGITAPGTSQNITYTYTVTCATAYASSAAGSSSPGVVVSVIAKPNDPAPATGLNVSSIGPDSSNVYWSGVSCNIGTGQYRIYEVSPTAGYVNTTFTSATSGTISNLQGSAVVWKVESQCIYNGLTSNVVGSGTSTYTSTVAAPTGSWYYWANNGDLYTDSNDWSCSGGATPQYQVWKTSDSGAVGYPLQAYGWTSVSDGYISGNYGAYLGAEMQARCYANGNVSSVTTSGQTTWVRGIPTPAAPSAMVRYGTTIYWAAVSCPAGTWAVYHPWITRQNNSGSTADGGVMTGTGWTRPSLSYGGWIYWHVQALCQSSWTNSGWSGWHDLNEPATSS